jgi:ribonuclease Z
MEPIKITFLGTGSSIPTTKRNHSAFLLTYKSENLLIDCGEGTQRQFKHAKISPTKITKLLITHWHGDHTLGLPGLFQTLHNSNYHKTLEIYGPKGTKHYLSLLEKLFKIKIKTKIHEITNTKKPIFQSKEFEILSKEMKHDSPALAYAFQIKNKTRLNKKKLSKLKITSPKHLKALAQGKSIKLKGKKISSKQVSFKEKGRKATFILDTLPNKNTKTISNNSTLLVCESTFLDKDKALAKKNYHLTAKQAAEIAKTSKSKSLYLTHISQRYDKNQNQILKEAKSVFKNTKIPKDLDSTTI